MTQLQPKQFSYLHQSLPISFDSIQESELKKLINNEFRHLQLDKQLHRKSLFDLIDYCELLYEQSYQVDGLKSYIKGYLVFNYFINTFVIIHFGGFDKFIESNEDDFIIYLNIYHFYNTNDSIVSPDLKIQAQTLRQEILKYLLDKNLLTYDVHELYIWLNEYIEYLKQKDQEQLANKSSTDSLNHNASSTESFQNNINITTDLYHPSNQNNISSQKVSRFDNDYQISDYKLYQSENFSSNSLDNFETRYPSINSKRDLIPSSPIAQSPSYNTNKPIPAVKMSSDFNHKNKKSYVDTPYPLKQEINEPYTVNEVPYPVGESDTDDGIAKRLNGMHISPRSFHQSTNTGLKTDSMETTSQIHTTKNGSDKNHNETSNGHTLLSGKNYLSNNITFQSNNPYNLSMKNSRTSTDINYSNGNLNFYNPSIKNCSTSNDLQYSNGNVNSYIPSIKSSSTSTELQYSNAHSNIISNGSNYKRAMLTNSNQYTRVQQPPPPIPGSTQTSFSTPPPVCRLKNLGSSCYINLTIQLLFGLQDFVSIFLNSNYHRLIKNPTFIRLLQNSKVNNDSLLLSDAISGLLVAFQKFNGSAIAPRKFLRVSGVLKPDFNIPHEQQDAQEFLLFVLERLHDELSEKMELSDASSGPILEDYISKWNIEVNPKDKPEYLKWYRTILSSEGKSPIHDIFQGHLQSKLICNKCGHESISFSPFTSLSLPIPSSKTQHVNLSDCLCYYTQDEVLSGENAWNCPKCCNVPHVSVLDSHPVFVNKKSGLFNLGRRGKSPGKEHKSKPTSSKNYSTTTKSLTFIKLPQVLLIHLARFSIFNLTDKLDTPIQYPLELKFHNNAHEIKYKLTGIINHYGNLKSGHYTALVNKSTVNFGSSTDNLLYPFWCFFDDDICKPNIYHGNVSQPGMENISSRDVYVLCYERI